MTTNFGRLRSDIGGIVMPSYEVPLIERTPPQSLWSKRARARGKYTIDPLEELVFKTENVDAIKDRIVEENIRKDVRGINRGAAMSHSGMMNPTLLGNNLSYAMRNENPRKAFRHGFYRPNIKNSFDVYRPIGKAPDRGIVVSGRVSRDTTVTTDMVADPNQTFQLESTTPVTVEGKTAVPTINSSSDSIPLTFTRKILDFQKNNRNIGRNAFYESIRTVQPSAVFRGTLETIPSTEPKLKDSPEVSGVVANSNLSVLGNSSDIAIPFNPDYIIREVEPITISAKPNIINIVDFVDVIDMSRGRSIQMRKTLPKILGQRFQVKVYDGETGNYLQVHEKDIPQIMAQSKLGGSISAPIEGSDKVIKLKDYRMVAYTARGNIPVLVLEPWFVPAKTKELAHIQVSSNIGSSNAETTDLFVPSFKEKNSVQISQHSEVVLPKQQNLGLSAKSKSPPVPVGTRGQYLDRVSIPSDNKTRPSVPFHQRDTIMDNPVTFL